MPDVTLHWRSFLVPKAGHAPEECEDAIAGDPEAGRFAIADGASESYAAGEWARLLTAAYVDRGPSGDWLAAPRDDWQSAAAGGAVSWYAEDKFSRGGHATFLGVSLRPATDGFTWDAIAAGDSCLLLARDGACTLSFPVTRSTEFNAAPTLIASRGGSLGWRTMSGTLRPGETLLLATDALAQFLLSTAETGEFAAGTLVSLEEDDDFALWVALARDQGRLRNDDVALGVVEVSA